VRPGELPAALADLRRGAWDGANVTVPHKLDAAGLVDALGADARSAGAVNVLLREPEGQLRGENTDGAGFVAGLASWVGGNGGGLPSEDAVLLGSGGAARGVAVALVRAGIRPLVVARRPERVPAALARAASDLRAWGDPGLAGVMRRHRLVVHATPLGTHPREDEAPPLPEDALGEGQIVVDLVYNPWQTLLLERARARGALGLNGWPMLVHQAALALDAWVAPGAGRTLPEVAREIEARDPRAP
jgi:shikimate dehydrogenase